MSAAPAEPPLFSLCKSPIAPEDDRNNLSKRISEALKTLAIVTIQIRRRQRLWELPNGEERVYHYTGPEILDAAFPAPSPGSAVIPSPKILLSFTGALNDPEEGNFFYFQLRNLSDKLGIDAKDLSFTSELLELRANQASSVGFSRNDALVFTASLCMEGDSLNLWRFYGKEGRGFAFGIHRSQFDLKNDELASELSTTSDKDNLYKVAYGQEEASKCMDHLLPAFFGIIECLNSDEFNTVDNRESYRRSIINSIIKILDTIAYLHKSNEYSAEGECRIIKILTINDLAKNTASRLMISGNYRPLSNTELIPLTGVGAESERSIVIIGPQYEEGAADAQIKVISKIADFAERNGIVVCDSHFPIVRRSKAKYRPAPLSTRT